MKPVFHLSLALVCLVLLWISTIGAEQEFIDTVLDTCQKVDLDLVKEKLNEVKKLEVVNHLISGANSVKNQIQTVWKIKRDTSDEVPLLSLQLQILVVFITTIDHIWIDCLELRTTFVRPNDTKCFLKYTFVNNVDSLTLFTSRCTIDREADEVGT